MMKNILTFLFGEKINWRPFIVSFIFVFLMAVLPHLGIKTPSLISPQPAHINIFDTILPKLEQKKNDYHVKKPTTFIGSAYAGGDYDQASSYILTNFNTGEVIAEKNSSAQLPIASLTKIMSAVVALDLVSPDETFTVSDDATHVVPTIIDLTPGEKVTVEELLNAMLLTSANDAAQEMMDGINQKYGANVFIEAMNAKARFLGLKDTHFVNPQGFDNPFHFSSAEDLATLTHYALTNYPLIASIVAKPYEDYPASSNHKEFYLNNWNGLLGVYPGASGVKIGNTGKAGYTTAVLSERNGTKLLAVMLGAPGILQRDMWTSELLDFGFEKWGLDPANVTEDQLRAKYATWKY